MPTAVEQPEQRKFSSSSGRRQYWIKDAADEGDALSTLLAAAPATWTAAGNTLYRRDPEAEVYEVGNDTWFGTVGYARQEASQTEDTTTFQFDTTGGTQHIIASLSTVGAFAAAGHTAATTDNGNLIGVGDGENVEGVDVPVGKFAFSITKLFAISAATAEFLAALAEIGTNDDTWSFTTDDGVNLSFAAGEVLFLGCSGAPVNNKFRVTFHFQASPNISGRVIGGITVTSAKGHQYIWVRQKHVVVQNRLTVQPIAAYVEQVVPEIDFELLGL